MGLPNLIYNGKVPHDTLVALGTEQTSRGFFTFAGEPPIRRWHVKPNQAIVYIHAEVEGLGSFGSYTITIGKRLGLSRIERVRGKRHPHCAGSICWGNLGSSVEHALSRHDIETVAGFCVTVLTSFWPSDAYEGWWSEEDAAETAPWICITCGDPQPAYSCRSCYSHICAHCAVTCIDAANRLGYSFSSRFCKPCVVDTLCTGEDCTHRDCWNHPFKDEPPPPQRAQREASEHLADVLAARMARETEVLSSASPAVEAQVSYEDEGTPAITQTSGSSRATEHTAFIRTDGTIADIAGNIIGAEVTPGRPVQVTPGRPVQLSMDLEGENNEQEDQGEEETQGQEDQGEEEIWNELPL